MGATDYISASDMPTELSFSDTARLALCITAASRAIDNHCRRVFYQSANAVKYFEFPIEKNVDRCAYVIFINDLIADSQTVVVGQDDNGDGTWTDTTLVADEDYRLFPLNEDQKTRVEVFDAYDRLKITGDWGYCDIASVPTEVKLACVMITRRYYDRSTSDPIFSERIGDYSVTYQTQQTKDDCVGPEKTILAGLVNHRV